jgi:hypothetical protein
MSNLMTEDPVISELAAQAVLTSVLEGLDSGTEVGSVHG